VNSIQSEYPDVAAANVEPLTHFVSRARTEERKTTEEAISFETYRPAFDIPREPTVSADPSLVSTVKAIAFYLPQFHPIPENDRWWGEGFTDWTNVRAGRPNFPGHYQPHIPAELGYYDLRETAVLQKQTELAKAYGIYGFCFYYYWFGGKVLLDLPIRRMLESGKPDFPFCICWANENWTRRWDGFEDDVLIAQSHSPEDDVNFIRRMENVLLRKNYIRICGKPLMLVYRPSLFPNSLETTERWRDYFRRKGHGELHLVMVRSFLDQSAPEVYGFNAAVQFPPHFPTAPITSLIAGKEEKFKGIIYDYTELRRAAFEQLISASSTGKTYAAVMPSWDNTARRGSHATIFANSSPESYYEWLSATVEQVQKKEESDERLIFINAWNEWAEGCHLEPDERYRYAWLNATCLALEAGSSRRDAAGNSEPYKSVPGHSMTTDPSLLVNAFYKAAFGRLADPEGLAHRIQQLQSGVSPEDLAEELVACAEFQTRHGSSQTVDKEYLTALYRAGLGRQPDPEWLANWLAAGEKGATRAKVLAALAGSNEALKKAESSANLPKIGNPALLVNAFYKAAFGRLADPEGLAHRIQQLQSGVSPEDLAEELVACAEFQTRYGSSQTVDKEYLTALYRAGLGRQPDPERLAKWLAAGEKGATRAKMLVSLAGSEEALKGVATLYVKSLYKTAFGRLADPEGLANRAQQLQSEVSLEPLAEELVASAEFQAGHGSNQKVDTEYLTALYRDALGREPDPEGLAHWLAEGEKGATRAKVLAAFAGSDEAMRDLDSANIMLPLAGIKPDRPTVLILIHEASCTGAPILGWNIARGLSGQNNVVAIVMREGPLEEAFAEVANAVVGPVGNEVLNTVEASRLARRLAEIYRPLYVIANSVATSALVPALSQEGVPVVALVHEFSATRPPGSLRLLYQRAAEIVFSADIVRRNSEIDYPFLRLRHTYLLPQGPLKVPRSSVPMGDLQRTETEQTIRKRVRPDGAGDDLVVVGMGFFEWRKGIDLFIATATAILAREPQAPVRFIWIGGGYRSQIAAEVSTYLSEQITRSGLGDRFKLMDAVDDVDSIYKEADVLFLSSRLDPLPNVSIDAAVRGIPVVCFAEASGMAEILASNNETRELVVPHLDVAAAAALIRELAADRGKLGFLGGAVRELARARFDMGAYVGALDELGRRASEHAQQVEADATVILTHGAFDLPLYLGEHAPFVKLAAAVREYSVLASKYNYARAPGHQACTRRPLAGFHPVTYALQNPDYDARRGGDPLAHYLRAGRPKGPWLHPVFRIVAPEDAIRPVAIPDSPTLRVVLHGHFHYTNHVGDFMRTLAANRQPCELILTTNSPEQAGEIRAALKKSQAEADVRVVPNRGRDIGAFLMVLEEAIGNCDFLGHVHGKRSVQYETHVGDRWRNFLWQHLIGDEMPMIDIIEQSFREDPRLGLVFPEDPHLVGWTANLKIAQKLAARMELRVPLPPTIDFPVGTMFWARPEALAPLLRLSLSWDEYPPEPLPTDGTMLHALERLLPLVAEESGYHYATTYLPRFVR
jgi:lipopolysaccharide biosynthesis protein/glycosyltransferase involved in cell wall biosynthesis